MKRLTLTCGMLLAAFSLLNAQTPSWQWGQRGGSGSTGTGGGPDESVVDMATDPHGNIYILAKVLQTGLNVDGHTVTGWGAQDWLITSFTCDGTYRWSKDIGTNSTDIPVAIKTDTLGGVYACGYLTDGYITRYIDTDTSWLATSYKSLLIVKYDTAGHYQWLRMPQPDSATIHAAPTRPLDMDVDGGGNIYWLCALPPGAYASGGYVVPSTGGYVLEYDKNGNFITGIPLPITYTGSAVGGMLIKRDYSNGRFYITGSTGTIGAGTTGLSFGSTPINHALFVGCFSSSGTFLWQKQDVLYGGGFTRPDIDASGNIYLTAVAQSPDTFNTYAVINTFDGAPFITKMDSNGNFLWAKIASTNAVSGCSAVNGATRCSILNGSEIDISGEYPGLLKWAGYTDSLNLPMGSGYQIFVTRFNTSTGAVIGLDSLVSSSGVNNDANSMTIDKFGNFYVGGDFASAITVNGTTLNSAGGGSDFFVAKYGTANCDTVLMPALATPAVSKTEERLRIYPNPATEELNVTGVTQHTTYRLLTVTGTALQQGVLQPGENVIPMRSCATGMYLLEMTGDDGTRNVVRVVKE